MRCVVVEPVDRVSLPWPVLAVGPLLVASVIASTLWLERRVCGNREWQADEGTPGPPALGGCCPAEADGRKWPVPGSPEVERYYLKHPIAHADL